MEEKLVTFEVAKLAKEVDLWDKLTGTDYVKGYYSEDDIEYVEFEMQLEDHVRGDYYYSPTQTILTMLFQRIWFQLMRSLNTLV